MPPCAQRCAVFSKPIPCRSGQSRWILAHRFHRIEQFLLEFSSTVEVTMRRILLLAVLVSVFSSQGRAQQVTGLQGWDIFLDPGHSRKENMGVYGYSEAEKNLRVALNLRDFLLTLTDIDTVYMSRTNDQQYVTLSQRTDLANRLGASWYHSIHSDASAPQYNSTLLLWGQYRDGREKVPNGGRAMSDIMVDLLTRGMRIPTRGSIGDCSFYGCTFYGPYLHVNRETTMPSELSEAGMHTNPRQNQLNMNAEWKRLEAKTFFWSILKFHRLPRPFAGTCAGIIYDAESRVPINGAHVRLGNREYVTDTFESLFHKYTGDPDKLHNGFYYFENLPDSTLTMTVRAPGYYPDTLTVSVVDTFFTFQDVGLVSSIPPRVISSVPDSGEQRFPGWENLIIRFSRKMNAASVETSLALTPQAELRFTWQNENRVLVVQTDTLALETDYQLVIRATARDQYGHLLDGNGDGVAGDEFVLPFRTGPADLAAPKITELFPAPNSHGVELRPLVNIAYD
ncbi:MAG TPA: hypothetical protein ENJ23_03900, partial [Bacteroidetes bacterium]|nr:hypothetical protein [Bacteroidota bacterium]